MMLALILVLIDTELGKKIGSSLWPLVTHMWLILYLIGIIKSRREIYGAPRQSRSSLNNHLGR